MDSAMLLIMYLSMVCISSGAVISTCNVTVEESVQESGSGDTYCDLFACPNVDFGILKPSGNITEGFEFPEGYSKNLCTTFDKLRQCGEVNLGLPEFQNNPRCEDEKQNIDLFAYFNSTFCQDPDLKDLETLRKCANDKEIQVMTMSIGTYFGGSMDIIDSLTHGYGIDGNFTIPREISTQLTCTAIGKLIRQVGWALHYKCGNDALAAFKKFAVKYFEFMQSMGYRGDSCPDLNIDDMFYGMRKKRSTDDFIFDMF